MSYFTISNWEAEEWSAEMEAIARDQFAPLVMSCGASCVDFIKTGELTFSVVTRYTDEAMVHGFIGVPCNNRKC